MLGDARTKWKDFGLALSMSQSTLRDSIDIAQRGHSGRCLTEMLAEWLVGVGGPPRTWSTLIAALKKVDEMEAIADDIEYRFGGSEVPSNSGELKHERSYTFL